MNHCNLETVISDVLTIARDKKYLVKNFTQFYQVYHLFMHA